MLICGEPAPSVSMGAASGWNVVSFMWLCSPTLVMEIAQESLSTRIGAAHATDGIWPPGLLHARLP